jgi:phosphatidate phosphatase APP1
MVRATAHILKKKFDHLKYGVKKELNLLDPVIIYPYRSYGYNGKISLKGRVLEKEKVVHSESNGDSTWIKLWRLFKRYESDEVPHAKLRIAFKDRSLEIVTDDEGYFDEVIEYDTSNGLDQWEKADYTLLINPAEPGKKITAEGEVMIPRVDSDFGIISDVDDTIIQSHALSPLKKLKTLAMNTAKTRVAFPGVAALYRALTHDRESYYKNPLWFISGSSWNLYDLLDDFCRIKNIPKAPFQLRKLGVTKQQWVKTATIEYKMQEIRPVMDLMNPLPFILIGDSGQKDPEIYKKVVEEYPERVKAIYIRDVSPPKRDKKVKEIAGELKEMGVDMVLASDSLEAAKHALNRNWITQEGFNTVKREVNEQK